MDDLSKELYSYGTSIIPTGAVNVIVVDDGFIDDSKETMQSFRGHLGISGIIDTTEGLHDGWRDS